MIFLYYLGTLKCIVNTREDANTWKAIEKISARAMGWLILGKHILVVMLPNVLLNPATCHTKKMFLYICNWLSTTSLLYRILQTRTEGGIPPPKQSIVHHLSWNPELANRKGSVLLFFLLNAHMHFFPLIKTVIWTSPWLLYFYCKPCWIDG